MDLARQNYHNAFDSLKKMDISSLSMEIKTITKYLLAKEDYEDSNSILKPPTPWSSSEDSSPVYKKQKTSDGYKRRSKTKRKSKKRSKKQSYKRR